MSIEAIGAVHGLGTQVTYSAGKVHGSVAEGSTAGQATSAWQSRCCASLTVAWHAAGLFERAVR